MSVGIDWSVIPKIIRIRNRKSTQFGNKEDLLIAGQKNRRLVRSVKLTTSQVNNTED